MVCGRVASSVLSPGLGQDGFAVVENGFGKVAAASRRQILQTGADGLPEIEVRKPTSPSGVGGPVPWSADAGELQCLASVFGCQWRGRLTCVVWDPDEMVVIHPS